MAKPNFQTGHGSPPGTTDESSLANGEASRGDSKAGDATGGDWEIPNSAGNARLSRILGLVFVVVLLGVFGVVAYKKYDQLKFHPDLAKGGEQKSTDPGSPVAANGQQPLAQQPSEQQSAGQQPAGAGDRVAGASNPSQAGQSGSSPPPAGTPASSNPFAELGGGPSAPAANVSKADPFGVAQQNPAQANMPQGAGTSSSQPNPFQSEPNATQQGPQDAFAQNAGNTASGSPNGTPKPATGLNMQTAVGSLSGAQRGETQNGSPPRAQDLPEAFKRSETASARPLDSQGSVATSSAAAVQGQKEPSTEQLLDEPKKSASDTSNASKPPSSQQTAARAGSNPFDPLSQANPLPEGKESRELHPTASPTTDVVGGAAATPGSTARNPAARNQTADKGNDLLSSLDNETPSQPSPTASAAAMQSVQASSNTTIRANPTSAANPLEDGFDTKGPASASGQRAPISVSKAGVASGEGRAAEPVDAGDGSYVVQPQDNYWTISRKRYGTSRYFLALAELNKARIPDPTRMRPGMKVSTPPADALEAQFATLLPAGTAIRVTGGQRIGKPRETGFFVTPDGRPMYRTGEKDTLSSIASAHLGRASRSLQIFEMNRDKLSNPNQLKPGLELALPSDASNVAMSNDAEDRR